MSVTTLDIQREKQRLRQYKEQATRHLERVSGIDAHTLNHYCKHGIADGVGVADMSSEQLRACIALLENWAARIEACSSESERVEETFWLHKELV